MSAERLTSLVAVAAQLRSEDGVWSLEQQTSEFGLALGVDTFLCATL